ncbi:MAG: Gfo/Idh/MocA family oxidoreductase [Clostridia bacterium]|nr:Gfo/Idh/MocA family oxidoreductase [Clostridia bacterium]
MSKIKFGIIGMGNQGNYYARLFNEGKITNGKLVACCDINPEKLKVVTQKYSAEVKCFSDYKSMIETGDCDAVLVVTPHYAHPEIVIECLKRGINVICDKPAGVYTKQVREMNEVAKQSNAQFAMMFNQRTNCVYRKMREIIANGGIGVLQRVTWIITDWYRTQTYYNNGSWRATWAGEGGGVLINQCPHQLDLIQWIVGEMPKKVNGFCHYGKWHDIEVEDDVTAYFEYENGATGVFITTTGEAPGTNRFEVSGSKGKLICENDKLTYFKNIQDSLHEIKSSEKGFGAVNWEEIEVQTDGQNPQHMGIINNFANALLQKEELFVDGVDGISGVELMNAIELSGWLGGEKVCIPVNEDKYYEELCKRIKTSKVKQNCTDEVQDTSNSFGDKNNKK